jgi:uncharacterized protein YqgC (DUF456 family)
MVLIAFGVLVYAIVTEFEKIGWFSILVITLVVLALETADVFFAMKSSPRFGPSRQGILYSLYGACVLALLFTPPFLVIGLLGGFLLGGLSGMLFAVYREESRLKPSHRMTLGVMFGRVSTLFFKGAAASLLVGFALLSSYD